MQGNGHYVIMIYLHRAINFIASIHKIGDRSKFHSENSDARVAEHYHSETICLSNGHRGRRNARVIPPKHKDSNCVLSSFLLRRHVPCVHSSGACSRATTIAIIVLKRCEKFVSSFRGRIKKKTVGLLFLGIRHSFLGKVDVAMLARADAPWIYLPYELSTGGRFQVA